MKEKDVLYSYIFEGITLEPYYQEQVEDVTDASIDTIVENILYDVDISEDYWGIWDMEEYDREYNEEE